MIFNHMEEDLVTCVPNSKINGRIKFILNQPTTRGVAKYSKSLKILLFNP
jgi:hypothetical protein